jgi:hypothetical protein
MKKISKKNIRIRYFNEISAFDTRNFFISIFDNILDMIFLNKNKNITIFKKSLYNYFLPGIFKFSIKNYIKNHSYINYYDLNNIIDLINKENIILIKYKDFVFLNNLKIFVYDNFYNMFFFLIKKNIYKLQILFCLFFL